MAEGVIIAELKSEMINDMDPPPIWKYKFVSSDDHLDYAPGINIRYR